VSPEDELLLPEFRKYLRYERGCSENTVKAYGADLLRWGGFCRKRNLPLVPPEAEKRTIISVEKPGEV